MFALTYAQYASIMVNALLLLLSMFSQPPIVCCHLQFSNASCSLHFLFVFYISPHSVAFFNLNFSELEEGHTNYLNRQLRPVVRSRRDVLDLAQREHAVYDFAEYDMFSIQEVAFCCCDKEL